MNSLMSLLLGLSGAYLVYSVFGTHMCAHTEHTHTRTSKHAQTLAHALTQVPLLKGGGDVWTAAVLMWPTTLLLVTVVRVMAFIGGTFMRVLRGRCGSRRVQLEGSMTGSNILYGPPLPPPSPHLRSTASTS